MVTHCLSLALCQANEARSGTRAGFLRTEEEHEHLARALGWRSHELDGDFLKFIYVKNDQHSGEEGKAWAVALLRRLARQEASVG